MVLAPGPAHTKWCVGDQCKMNREIEERAQFVEVGNGSSEILGSLKHPFDLVFLFAHFPIMIPKIQEIDLERCSWLHAQREQQLPFCIPLVGFIPHHLGCLSSYSFLPILESCDLKGLCKLDEVKAKKMKIGCDLPLPCEV